MPRRRALLVLAAIAGAAAVALAVAHGMRAGVRVALIPEEHPYVALDREITAEFGMQNPVVWVIEARDGTVWTPALLARIQAVTRAVLKIRGVIALDVVSLASPNLRDLQVTEDSLTPVYLMATVPQTSEAIAALRRRVDSNPNYGGMLVSRDGRAAMVVGNFVADADPQAIAAAALALRERYSDAAARVAVTGGPVLRAAAPAIAAPLAAGVVLTLAVGLLVLALTCGRRAALGATLAAIVAVAATAAIVVACGAAVVPWSVYALLPTALAAAGVTLAPAAGWRARLDLGVVLATAFVALAVVAGAPAAAYGTTGAVGIAAALLAGETARGFLRRAVAPRARPVRRFAALGVVVVAAIGAVDLRSSFGLFGYGLRYLPASAAADLRVLRRDFPPPTALAIRFRGNAGFVASPAVLQTFDALTAAARRDPAVVRALSLADLVKMVHRAFNENRDEFLAIPNDQSLIARYLALAYSPGFRTFVNRAFTRSVVWVYLASDQPADLARVLAALEAELAAHPLPAVQVDVAGGDGAVVLATAGAAQRLAAAAAVWLLLAALGAGVLCGARAGLAALAGGVVAAAGAGGALGWLGVPLDLLSLPCLISAAVAGTLFGVIGGTALDVGLGAMAVAALVGWVLTGTQLALIAAIVLAALAAASTLTVASVGHQQAAAP